MQLAYYYFEISSFKLSPLARRPDSTNSLFEGKSFIEFKLKYIKKSLVVCQSCGLPGTSFLPFDTIHSLLNKISKIPECVETPHISSISGLVIG